MGDPPSDHPGVHPPDFKPPKWDGRRKAVRDAEEARKKKEAKQKQEAEARARRRKQAVKATKRQAQQMVKAVEFEDRRVIREIAAWEWEDAKGPPPIPLDELPAWALALRDAYGSWELAAEAARTFDFEDPANNVTFEGPGWERADG